MINTLWNVGGKVVEGRVKKKDNEKNRSRRRVCYKVTETLTVLRTSQY
jgi:hypothetical protein